jgi:hypothetical protein
VVGKIEEVFSPAACSDACAKGEKDCDTFVYSRYSKDCILYRGARLKKGSKVLFGNNVGGWCPGKGETQLASTSHIVLTKGRGPVPAY